MSKPNERVNYGIIGPVTAKAVAAGPHAQATVNEAGAVSREEFDGALKALRAQIAALEVPEQSRQLLHDDVTKIEQMASQKPEQKAAASDVLKGLVDKLKMIGVFMQTAVGLAGPIKIVAGWLGVPIPF
jgi:hypothetical protein